ncbi:family 43 glycosylhydrolase [Lederbergia sp. NSJ-179]|uniref:family 43 glycosylhydrolase n=1 Tax=Lederbergia sp. NSJ-179 TaxID=2931402 RepID=UPI001FD4D6C6|nr:family 43 glycosylhydrolase [Lederbergia sp. NSJ-179]MCJ7842888.1 family 43 glycosylhydrolase [Lederbergia sp. NSJ-179]
MNRNQYFTILYLSLMLLGLTACTQIEEVKVDINMDKMQTYANPFELADEWPDYGIGDPYVFRYNGTYYLYVSTKDARVGIKAWSSTDLVNWTYEGLVTEDERTTSAYAPEVVYWNGTFYMYTSPAGNGHYVLSSKSPTGPFKIETENLGMSIDGSVFIDDDGSWYFTHAGNTGIVGHRMKDPYTFEEGVETNVFLDHWTEGSMIIKNNDFYYMTYTGNHVFSKGYRINYAVSEKGPLEGYEVPEHNPILISTQDDFNGLGHNSIVMGPNLDSYYAIYHNLIGRSAEGPPVRKMNIDRMVFNGKKLDVLGPTHYPTPVPDPPDFEKRWEENEQVEENWFSEVKTKDHFTAEFNFAIPEKTKDAKVATQFSYQDDGHYGAISIDLEGNKIELLQVVDGKTQILGSAAFPEEFDFSSLHNIRIENRKNKTIVFLDGMKKMEVEATNFGAGEIGYQFEHANLSLGYTAFSNHVDHSSDYELYKPLPGTIEAVHYLEGENRGYSIKEPSTENRYRENVPVQLREDGSYSVTLKDKGDWLKYKVNASVAGLYEVSAVIHPNSVKSNFSIGISIDDEKQETFKVKKGFIDGEAPFQKVRLGRINIEEGFHLLKLWLKGGDVEINHLEFNLVSDEKLDLENGIKQVEADDIHGAWKQHKDGVDSNSSEDMKLYVGDEKWTDVEAELTFEINDELMDEAGLLLRVTNESDFEHQVKDSLMGYYVSFNAREISLQKLNYNSTELQSTSVSLDEGKEYRLRVSVENHEINVYLDHKKEPILSYKDPMAFMNGKVGIRSEYSDVYFKQLKIKSLP